jgi:hypothetical protein
MNLQPELLISIVSARGSIYRRCSRVNYASQEARPPPMSIACFPPRRSCLPPQALDQVVPSMRLVSRDGLLTDHQKHK